VTRVISGAVLVALALAAVWLSSDRVLLAVGVALVVLAVEEFVRLARASALEIARGPVLVATALTFAVVSTPQGNSLLDVALMSAFVGLGLLSLALWQGGPNALASVSASLFPALYIGLPIGALVAIRRISGPSGLFLLMLTVIVSDSAQYYTGRRVGRRPLAPMVSPKKTIEGAVGGCILGTTVFVCAGAWWLPSMPIALRVGLGLALVALGIAGDLFESMLKRSAGVKDSSALIPGHGGILDRIDALLFAAPVYYIILKYA
jgi:phosphatidate cytidylyltransferase